MGFISQIEVLALSKQQASLLQDAGCLESDLRRDYLFKA
jgi:hypothetical protein